MSKPTVYIIDDNRDFRESTSWMLVGAGYSVEEYGDPEMALTHLRMLKCRKRCCCLLDIRMPTMTGLEFHEQLATNQIYIPIIYMTGHGDISLAVEAMSMGAVTFLEKPLDSEELWFALDTALSIQSMSRRRSDTPRLNMKERMYQKRFAALTPREDEILQEIVAGKMNKVIAMDLGISVKTVELHRSRVMTKMKAVTPADLVKMFLTKRV
ncbi:MAG: response regulator [Candidatus Thiodiazotropha sp. (ex Dulcina madagascariensis)]|nr:response regulator [Candidatus Thiodiazotropha sp. (ex Epidulcina cf. delphinae)]MCU7935499.1 response regulator [Candidatus Thiodiazotropha sp. (ex Dulcina madagascariensis)]